METGSCMLGYLFELVEYMCIRPDMNGHLHMLPIIFFMLLRTRSPKIKETQ